MFGFRRKRAAAAAAEAARAQLEPVIQGVIQKHARALSTKRQQLVQVDAYGMRNTELWDKEKFTFLTKVLLPACGVDPTTFRVQGTGLTRVIHVTEGHPSAILVTAVFLLSPFNEWIEEAVNKLESSPGYTSSSLSRCVDEMSPLEYERHCADLLTSFGWQARVTKGSGDQGADVIAEKNGMRVVLQCKKYSKPVGNKAVQEALAAMKFENANFAAVVSNVSYTSAAVSLGHKSGVALLHHGELDRLDQIANEKGIRDLG